MSLVGALAIAALRRIVFARRVRVRDDILAACRGLLLPEDVQLQPEWLRQPPNEWSLVAPGRVLGGQEQPAAIQIGARRFVYMRRELPDGHDLSVPFAATNCTSPLGCATTFPLPCPTSVSACAWVARIGPFWVAGRVQGASLGGAGRAVGQFYYLCRCTSTHGEHGLLVLLHFPGSAGSEYSSSRSPAARRAYRSRGGRGGGSDLAPERFRERAPGSLLA